MPGRHDMEPMSIATSDGPYDDENEDGPCRASNRALWVTALAFTFAGAFAGSALTNLGNGSGARVGGRPEGGGDDDGGGGEGVGDAFDHAVGHLQQKGKKGGNDGGGGGAALPPLPRQGPDREGGPREGSRDNDGGGGGDDEFDAYEDGTPADRTKTASTKKTAPVSAKKQGEKGTAAAAKTRTTPRDDDDDDDDKRVHPRPPGADSAPLRPSSPMAESPRYDASSWGSDPHPSSPRPRLAWLVSFPNSGTSYTAQLVRSVTKTYTGSNYGDVNVLKEGRDGVGDTKGRTKGELHGVKGTSVPIFESSPGGPFWADPSGRGLKAPESGYILTKTHCGAYCMNCGPSKYIITEHMFLNDCLSGKYTHATKKRGEGGLTTEKTTYRSDLINRAVHLVRDPFDNVVSRFHLEVNKLEKKAKRSKDIKSDAAAQLARYSRDRGGFRAFCDDEAARFADDETTSHLIDDEMYGLIKGIPCHADFVRYVRWHNLAFVATNNLRAPTLVLHYEDYEDHFHRTVLELTRFLEREIVAAPKEFEKGKRYGEEYFTFEERGKVYELMKGYGYRETWDALGRYFDEKETGRFRGRRRREERRRHLGITMTK